MGAAQMQVQSITRPGPITLPACNWSGSGRSAPALFPQARAVCWYRGGHMRTTGRRVS